MAIDTKNFNLLLDQIAEEKGLSREQILETIEQAIAAAYKKDYGKRGQVVKARLNSETGLADFWQVKLVVDDDMIYSQEELEEMSSEGGSASGGKEERMEEGEQSDKKVRFNPERHFMVKEARKEFSKVKPGEEVEIPLERNMDYGRIAAQTAKQVILQKIREAERTALGDELKSKEGELISGIVQRVEGRVVLVDLGKVLGAMPREEQVPGEFYRMGQRLKFYVLRVEDTSKGPAVTLSRAYPKFVSRLFKLEVPEIAAETVQIKAIAREPGFRSKVAVVSTDERVDPIGAMVGQRGTRVSAVINELGGEKIDIIEWAEDQETYVGNALSPAKVLQVEAHSKGRAVAVVPEDQLSLAIGKEGQNVRLAAKLTGWKIDIRTPEGTQVDMKEEVEEEAAA
ncbi:MAG: transcription termination factor NusA [Patescibacteria group bacterium]